MAVMILKDARLAGAAARKGNKRFEESNPFTLGHSAAEDARHDAWTKGFTSEHNRLCAELRRNGLPLSVEEGRANG